MKFCGPLTWGRIVRNPPPGACIVNCNLWAFKLNNFRLAAPSSVHIVQLLNRFPRSALAFTVGCTRQLGRLWERFSRETIKNNGFARHIHGTIHCGGAAGGKRDVSQRLPRHILVLSTATMSFCKRLLLLPHKEQNGGRTWPGGVVLSVLHLRWLKKIIIQVLSHAIYGFSRAPASSSVHFRHPSTTQ